MSPVNDKTIVTGREVCVDAAYSCTEDKRAGIDDNCISKVACRGLKEGKELTWDVG